LSATDEIYLIGFYQKYISPVKGFTCAYGHLHKNGTCSSRIFEIVSNSPFRDIPSQASLQFKKCAQAQKVTLRMIVLIKKTQKNVTTTYVVPAGGVAH